MLYCRRYRGRKHLVIRDGIGPHGGRELVCGPIVPSMETDAGDAPPCPECRAVVAAWLARLTLDPPKGGC